MVQTNQIDILLIEDDDYDAELSLRELQRHPSVNSALHFRSAEMALEYLSTTDCLPKVVLIDLNLSGMSGFDLIKKITLSEFGDQIKIAILSGSNMQKDEVTPYLADRSYFFEKPLNWNKIIHVMCPMPGN